LEATEVEAAQAASEPRAEATEARAVDAPPDAADASPPVQPDPPPPKPPRDPPLDPPPDPPADTSPEPSPDARPTRRVFAWLPEELSWAQAGAGVAGATGALLVFLLLWLVGAFSGGHDALVDFAPRLAAIERQLQTLAARPMPASVDPKAVDELAARLAKVENAQAAPRAPVTDPVVLGRLNAAEQATQSLADNAAALSRRGDALDGALRDVQTRLEKISAALDALRTDMRAAAAGSDRASRLALAAAALRDAVERGDPFTAEFAVVKPISPDADALAALEPFAPTGVPREAALASELAAAIKPMLRPAGEPQREGGFFERLQANAENLVRIRPVGEMRGDDRNAGMARIEQLAVQGNVSGALAELAKLPAAAREPFQPWIARTQARQRAIDAGRRLASDAVAALKAAP
jgi:hypothetical protein